MSARTIRAIGFTLALTSTALCFAQEKTLSKVEVLKVIQEGEALVKKHFGTANGIRALGRVLQDADYKKITWCETQVKYLREELQAVSQSLKSNPFVLTTAQRKEFEYIRRRLRQAQPKKVVAKPKVTFPTAIEKELKALALEREHNKLEQALAGCRQGELSAKTEFLNAQIERIKSEKSLEEIAKKVEATPNDLTLERDLAGTAAFLERQRLKELKAKDYMLRCRVATLTAQAKLDVFDAKHALESKIGSIKLQKTMKSYWTAFKIKLVTPATIDATHIKLFTWCGANKLDVKGPVVHLYPRFFQGKNPISDASKLGVGVVLSEPNKAVADADFGVEKIESFNAMTVEVIGPYEKIFEHLADVIGIVKLKKLKPVGPIMIYYHSDPANTDPTKLRAEFVIPLAKK
jgi:hypothetical protein